MQMRPMIGSGVHRSLDMEHQDAIGRHILTGQFVPVQTITFDTSAECLSDVEVV